LNPKPASTSDIFKLGSSLCWCEMPL